MADKKPENRAKAGKRKPTSTSWKPGQSGNEGGRPKTDPELVEAFRARTTKALAVLDKVLDGYIEGPSLDDDGAVQAVRAQDAVKASEVVLNRGWGTAPATIKLDATLDAKVKTEETKQVTFDVNPKRLERIAAVLQRAGVLQVPTEKARPVESDETSEEETQP